MIVRVDERGAAGSKRLAKISELEAKLKQLKERQQAVETRRRTLESRRERKADTRRKILVGAIVLAKVEHGEIPGREPGSILLSPENERGPQFWVQRAPPPPLQGVLCPQIDDQLLDGLVLVVAQVRELAN